ncbi:hypothetical protein PBCVNEJV1_031L [Paramecium bursaria Chlorella virus NE-JV-1]|nr:hypothetical protein PBCVNEJV1_031L [Paramecium bursaria Chlorella virus NE-JV-1]
MDALVVLALLTSVAEQLAGRKKCGCDREGLEKRPKYYMKLGLPGGERYWCEECTDRPPEAVYLDNYVCCTPGCNKRAHYAKDGTRDNRICDKCRDDPEVIPEDEQNKYKNVVSKKCITCEKTHPSHAIVPEGKTYKDVRPVLCKTCVGKLPTDVQNKYEDVVSKRCRECEKTHPVYAIVPEGKTYKDVRPVLCKECVGKLPTDVQVKYENVAAPRCQHEGCDVRASYAEDFTGFPVKYCAVHTPIGFVCTAHKLCETCNTNTIAKNKYPGVCARCDGGNYGRYENAVLDILKEKYEIATQFPVYGDGNTRYPLRLDGAMFADDVIVTIEVDEKKGHNSAKAKELDAARMIVCDKYFEKKYSLPVAWIRIVPDISDKSLGEDKDQFGDVASKIRREIVKRAMEKINSLLKNPASGVFYFRQ